MNIMEKYSKGGRLQLNGRLSLSPLKLKVIT